MAASTQNINNTTIRSILLAEKLTGSNFKNWYRNLRIVLKHKKKMKFVEQPARPPNPETTDSDTIDKYYESVNLEQEVACLMLLSMSPDIQRTLEKYNAYDMLKELETMFKEQTKQELFEPVKAFHACKQEEGQSDYDQFVQNYNMHSMGKTIDELHAMLKLYKKGILKKAETPVVLAIWESKIKKDKKNHKGKKKEERVLAFLVLQGLRENRKLKHGALSLYVRNGMQGYALESTVRILNMVLSKKVERTPYKIWHGRVWGCEALVK
nr:hypothetical protein [Tanacetum cinerariifolium]